MSLAVPVSPRYQFIFLSPFYVYFLPSFLWLLSPSWNIFKPPTPPPLIFCSPKPYYAWYFAYSCTLNRFINIIFTIQFSHLLETQIVQQPATPNANLTRDHRENYFIGVTFRNFGNFLESDFCPPSYQFCTWAFLFSANYWPRGRSTCPGLS